MKAVEYFLKDKMTAAGPEGILEFVHFGLTSQDINNTAVPLSLKEALEEVLLPRYEETLAKLDGPGGRFCRSSPAGPHPRAAGLADAAGEGDCRIHGPPA